MATNLIDLKDLHKGKRGLICGSGPSLNMIDFDKISKDIVIFACNQAITVLKYCDYFCMTDAAVPENESLFKHGYDISKNIASLSGDKLWQITKLPFYNEIKNKLICVDRENNKTFDLNKTNNLILGNDVIQPATHLAHIMGCDPIILIGVDLTYKYNMYCKSKTYTKEIKWASTNNEQIFMITIDEWKKIKNQTSNINIFNASPISKLTEIFNTIDIKELYD